MESLVSRLLELAQRQLRAADDLAAEYGGAPTDWAKMTSSSYKAADGVQIQTRWYENLSTGERVEYKVKITP